MREKIRIAIIFGGRSKEHKISLLSSKSIIKHLSNDKYDKILIGIDRDGLWYLHDTYDYLVHPDDPEKIEMKPSENRLSILPSKNSLVLINTKDQKLIKPIDIVFPVLHGSFGEDGTIQGLFEMAGVKYIGCNVLSSSICMDKEIAKRLLMQANILNSRFLSFTTGSKDQIDYEKVSSILGSPLFIKPANLGSSVGITKVFNKDEFYHGIDHAFRYDHKILIEEAVKGREIECSVLGNDDLIASVPGEVIPKDEFYSYKAKYLDENGAILSMPAELDNETILRIQSIAKKTFKLLACKGMARVDFFLKEDGSILVNEVNTIPGFTDISMYPKLLYYTGIPYSELLDRLVELALA